MADSGDFGLGRHFLADSGDFGLGRHILPHDGQVLFGGQVAAQDIAHSRYHGRRLGLVEPGLPQFIDRLVGVKNYRGHNLPRTALLRPLYHATGLRSTHPESFR